MQLNVTATKDGEEIENGDVDRTGICGLLDYADEIVVHAVHDDERLNYIKADYADEWDEKVVDETDADETVGSDAETEADEHMFASDDSECRHVDCSETPEMAAECDTGQTKYYCNEHSGGSRAGHATVEEWVEL